MSDYRYAIGQRVRLIGEMRMAAVGDYEITALLPPDASGECQYRIKSENEAHERVSLESSLIARSGNAAA